MGLRDRARSFAAAVGAFFLGIVVLVVGIIDFVVDRSVALSLVGSIWLAVTGEWQAAVILLLVALVVSWFVFGT